MSRKWFSIGSTQEITFINEANQGAARGIPDGASTKAYQFRIRYRQPLQTGILERKGDYVYIWFESPQSGVASGQFAAWYDGPECVGSGVIAS